MRVLVACEYSGAIRDEFIRLGHEALSCDLLPTESPGPHYQGDVLDILDGGFDLMIAHPPCTFLSNAGNAYFQIERYADKAIERWRKRIDAMEFFMKLYNAPIQRICVENPLGFPISAFRKPDQIIQPYYFGDPHFKTTCLWLKNTPPLTYSNGLFMSGPKVEIPKPIYIDKSGKARHFTDSIAGDRGGQKVRSKTFPGIARAIAEQWGKL